MIRWLLFLPFIATPLLAEDSILPPTKPLPKVQVLPLPHAISSFQLEERELTASLYVPADMRPFWYPIMTSQGVRLTRMRHSYEPVTHSHHNSVRGPASGGS
ncbi:hypothetical protein BH11VER1_BH11VER1_37060 [soil metagenome]